MLNQVIFGDCRETMRMWESGIIQTCVTSPPYFGLRDYGVDGQLGLEPTPEEYIANMVAVFREVKRVLRDDGTLWLNIGDSYFSDSKGTGGASIKQDSNVGSRYSPRKFNRTNGLKPKDLIGIPWMLAFALRADGWYLRQDIIWHKPNPMPESVTDRCTKAHEYIFLLSKSAKYYFDNEAIQEPTSNPELVGKTQRVDYRPIGTIPSQITGDDKLIMRSDIRNKRSVWTVNTKPYSGAHFAVFPEALIEPCILGGSKVGDVVLDPFFGSGTTGQVCENLGREWIGCELNPAYDELQKQRTSQQGMVFT